MQVHQENFIIGSGQTSKQIRNLTHWEINVGGREITNNYFVGRRDSGKNILSENFVTEKNMIKVFDKQTHVWGGNGHVGNGNVTWDSTRPGILACRKR